MQSDKQLDQVLLTGYLAVLSKVTLEKMLNVYIVQSSLYLKEISNAIKADSQLLWQNQCHKMKGAAASVGLKLVHAKLNDIEKSTDQDRTVSHSQLCVLNGQAIDAYQQWLVALD